MTVISWLHVSDWHQRETKYVVDGKTTDLFNRSIVLRALLEDIENRELIAPELGNLAFIVFSGDAAFSGKEEQFAKAKEMYFDKVLSAAGLGKDKLFMIPGNHDIDRSSITPIWDSPLMQSDPPTPQGSEKKLTKAQKQQFILQDSQVDDEKRNTLLVPFAEYEKFVQEYLGSEFTSYLSVKKFTQDSISIGVMGLNSALLCGQHKIDVDGKEDKDVDDYAQLMIGEPQVDAGLAKLNDLKPHVRIIVMHHPFDWLMGFEQKPMERILLRGCDILLRGHTHESNAIRLGGVTGDCLIVPSGATYEQRDLPTGYSYISLDLTSERPGIRVYFRRWSEPRHKWVEDNDTAEGGTYAAPLPPSLEDLVPEPSPPIPAASDIAALIADLNYQPLTKARLGRVLASTGDPRPGIRDLKIEWCYVPSGTFPMGGDPQCGGTPSEQMAKAIDVTIHHEFWISRYPVTNAQYRLFIADGGATEKYRDCWSTIGWDFVCSKPLDGIRKGQKSKGARRLSWDGMNRDLANHPVVGISWHEAYAFTRWLQKSRKATMPQEMPEDYIIRLPLEQEWEKAARWDPQRKVARVYPYGNEFMVNNGNTNLLEIARTVAVGLFPAGAAPCDAEDMSGNVWEWCHSIWMADYRLPEAYSAESIEARAIRGSAWIHNDAYARSATRGRSIPTNRFNTIGFRLIVAKPLDKIEQGLAQKDSPEMY